MPIAVLALPLIAVLAFQTIPVIAEEKRKKQLSQISGILHPGYFRLTPRDDETSFVRADGAHHDILHWLQHASSSVLYLTGLSGSGKKGTRQIGVILYAKRLPS
jgi:hypothetical protein